MDMTHGHGFTEMDTWKWIHENGHMEKNGHMNMDMSMDPWTWTHEHG
jgi:hypothetical protein